ncbi:MAG: tRNA pseudouridine(13) synthase TruD [Nitrososphaerales archaeon]
MQPPPLDRSIGMMVYATPHEGVGGRLRVELEDFFVEEILDGVVFRHLSNDPQKQNSFTLYTLTKEGLDTLHASEVIKRKFGVRVKYLGIKDARAVTTQYITIPSSAGCLREKVSDKITVRKLGYLTYPLNRNHLLGNRFKINVRDVIKAENLDKILDALREHGVPNFFGYQRFGSRRPVSHLIGRALVKRRFEEAVELLLSYTTGEEDLEVQRLRRLLSEEPSVVDIESLPPLMDIEKTVLRELKKSPTDYVKAVKALPLRITRLFVNAYQSYIFNKTLSAAIEDGVNLSSIQPSDLYAEFAGLKMGEVKKADCKISLDNSKKPLLLCPIVGYRYREERSGRFRRYVSEILSDEGLSPRSFYIDEIPELSVEGDLRPATIPIESFGAKFDGSMLSIEATLSKGCYITSLLREIIKPADPVNAGF